MSLENDQQLRQSIVALLYKMSAVDKEVSAEELSYIVKVGSHIGVDREEVGAIILNHDTFDIQPPKNEKDRMTILYYLLFLMKADSKIDDQEVNLIREFAFKLGFRSNMTDELINTVIDNLSTNISPEILLETIRKYNN